MIFNVIHCQSPEYYKSPLQIALLWFTYCLTLLFSEQRYIRIAESLSVSDLRCCQKV